MYKKFLLACFLLLTSIIIIYPSKEENIEIFDYCYSLEKILSRNSMQTRENLSSEAKSISIYIAKFGVAKTKVTLINKMIDKYKNSKNIFIINILPNEIYCLAGYWIEKVRPGTFESIFYQQSKNAIKEYKDGLDLFIDEINLEYKNIQKEFENLF